MPAPYIMLVCTIDKYKNKFEINNSKIKYNQMRMIIKLHYNIEYNYSTNKHFEKKIFHNSYSYIYFNYVTSFNPISNKSYIMLFKNDIYKSIYMYKLGILYDTIYSYFIYNKYYRSYTKLKYYNIFFDIKTVSKLNIKIFNCRDLYKIILFI